MKLPAILDNDCLSSFLWVRKLSIITGVIGESGIIPEPVYDEYKKMLRYPKYSFIYHDMNAKVADGTFTVVSIGIGTPEYKEYERLISVTNPMRIDKGEAAAIVLTKVCNGTLCSNNLCCIGPYIRDGSIPYACTDRIMYEGLQKGLIKSIVEGNQIWQDMKDKDRKLPLYDFAEAVRRLEKEDKTNGR